MKKMSLAMQAKEQFLEMYEKGEFVPGQRIPSESEMSKLFGISRETWRSSLELLRREGILYSKHGAGTYLLDDTHKIENDLSELRSLSEMIRNAGIEEGAPKLTITSEYPSAEVAQLLRLTKEESVCVIKRIRYSEAGAICSSINYIPGTLADELDFKSPPSSIFNYFEKRKGILVARSTTRIVIPSKDDPLISELRKMRDVAILGLKQLHFDSRGNPAMYSIDYLRCDLFDFSITRIRQR
ncbi:GntR family transcriptional regulator [Sinanaerobacter chloroacetimidivorans]|uniref:GntR family transcriptional regulator n=1 Tax=Sinanaerobacter chloroacetimidivorans TaxID=2818044 RepID=A0A8J7W738_9FIRM|nr:GntR family transcriptional regulator [Sinanaerobacter chloroacetimidivorans]MBR0600196.1 GntR family transcriptional regulator [Sinanaerobacter chloroacetimidivorans]